MEITWHSGRPLTGSRRPRRSTPAAVGLPDWALAPGDQHASEARGPATKDLIQVHPGRVTVEVADV
jgi:hypothetical protein